MLSIWGHEYHTCWLINWTSKKTTSVGILWIYRIFDFQIFAIWFSFRHIWEHFLAALVASLLQNGSVPMFHQRFAIYNGRHLIYFNCICNWTPTDCVFNCSVTRFYLLELECTRCFCSKNECVARWILKWRKCRRSTKNEFWWWIGIA